MKWEIAGQMALIGILAPCAVSLEGQLSATRSQVNIERARAVRSERLMLTSIAGVDVLGQVVEESRFAGAKRMIVYGLRDSTLDQDISLWSTVAHLLATDHEIYIVAYCKSRGCKERVSQVKPAPPFTVIAYGEVGSIQAILNADSRGECLILDGEMRTMRGVLWRTPGKFASDIAREIRE